VRSNAWIWAFSSTQSTSAPSGGFRYRPTMSRAFSTNCGSGESLNDSVRCDFGPHARQTRLTVDWLIPVALAIDRVDRRVACAGVSSSAFTITRSTCSSVTVCGTPGAARRSTPPADAPRTAAAICRPSAGRVQTVSQLEVRHALRTRQHDPPPQRKRPAHFGRRAQRSNVSRFQALRTTSDVDLPSCTIAASYRRRRKRQRDPTRENSYFPGGSPTQDTSDRILVVVERVGFERSQRCGHPGAGADHVEDELAAAPARHRSPVGLHGRIQSSRE
jgi:hypothetical protein